ncbi:type IV pilus assembly protein PilA [Ureibacillus acetophenoni]|uniref:Type IV pilus assembly protein PilA n=2 Tax=Ureibacillus acetophenoni TaxID=614649 RepID=A0A285UD72_9BACL|nr:type IV pilus assembly protein PilA [Ureibacillus acetophenoni]
MKKFLKQLLNKRLNNEKGLTLIELLAVIVILAIVAAIAVPAIGNIIENSRIKALKSDAVTIINAAQIYYTDGKTDAFTLGGDSATGTEYVQLSSTPTDIEVTKTGEISGSLAKDGYTLTFTSATVAEINVESPDPEEGIVVISKPSDES